MIAAFYAAILAIVFVALSIYVIKARTAGRLSHAYGMSVAEASNPPNLKYRIFGMKCTFITLVSAAVLLLVQVVPKIISGN